jgi:hypothetical protein
LYPILLGAGCWGPEMEEDAREGGRGRASCRRGGGVRSVELGRRVPGRKIGEGVGVGRGMSIAGGARR